MIDEQVRQRGFPEVDLIFRHKMEGTYEQVKAIFRDASVQILEPPGSREFLIADVPVCGYRFGSNQLGPLDGLGLYHTGHFTMPLSPKYATRLAISKLSGYYRLSGTESDKVNARQIQHAYRELYLRPGSTTEEFVMRNMAAWRKPAAISPLSIV
ncbi:hypothetical protein AMK25_05425 [Micromonospora sp. TSRI0369]|nr:hypothetical protein AMK25_05425 [Micromonospora sp. TSRI0369]